MQKKETDFCGYSVPHPYEPKLNLRLQTMKTVGKPANSVLLEGLRDMVTMCDLMEQVFEEALTEFNP